jgi:heme A synthase
MPDAIGKPMNFQPLNSSGRGSAVTATPSRKRRWWMAAIVVVVLALGAVAAYRYFSLCRNCSPILCDDPCTLPTFGQVLESHAAHG